MNEKKLNTLFTTANILTLCLQFYSVSCQSNQWYNWYHDNAGKAFVENGILPNLTCPYGHYRQFKVFPHVQGGINLDGCIKCPPGVFGNTTDLSSPNCTAPCPLGTYNDEEGASSVDDCKPCPAGTYGDTEGLTSPACSGICSKRNILGDQFYSIREGLKSIEECDICPLNYNYHSCHWDVPKVTDIVTYNHSYLYQDRWIQEADIEIPITYEIWMRYY